MIEFKINYAQYDSDTNVASDCNAIYFRNAGNVPLTINNQVLLPGEVDTNSGEQGEKDVSVYALVFDPTGIAAPEPLLYVKRKNYV